MSKELGDFDDITEAERIVSWPCVQVSLRFLVEFTTAFAARFNLSGQCEIKLLVKKMNFLRHRQQNTSN